MWQIKNSFICFLVALLRFSSCISDWDIDSSSRIFKENDTTNRSAKFFGRTSSRTQSLPLYAACQAQTNVPGICLSSSECLRGGGSVSGVCWPIGICCYSTMECNGQASTAKLVFVSNNGLISGPQNDCVYTILPYSRNVGQLRIDFSTHFPSTDITGEIPAQIPECEASYIRISGKNYCGSNLRQHLYVPFSSENTVNGQIIVRNMGNVPALWEFTVTQIEVPPEIINPAAGSLDQWRHQSHQTKSSLSLPASKNIDMQLMAPVDCDQFFLEERGTVRSFNFNGGLGLYPPNLRYNICIRKFRWATGITLNFTNFHLGSNGAEPCVIMNPADPTMVSNDYLSIAFQETTEENLNKLQFCNMDLHQKVIIADSPSVFMLRFNSGNYLGPRQQLPTNTEIRAFEFFYIVTTDP